MNKQQFSDMGFRAILIRAEHKVNTALYAVSPEVKAIPYRLASQ
jgi:hypothetical protein